MTSEPDRTSTWWTFAGLRANVQLAHALETRAGHVCTASNISIDVDGLPAPGDLEAVLDRDTPLAIPESAIEQATKAIKFSEYLPEHLRRAMVEARLRDDVAIEHLRTQVRV